MSNSKKSESFNSAGKFVMQNSDCVLVHGLVNSFDLAEMPYAWVRRGNKVYDVEHDKWYTEGDWSSGAVEKNTYSYSEVLKLVDFTSHLGPWTSKEYEEAMSG
ncbi:MAG: hypothetical protein ACHQ1H_11700 [Nitrososphaerales archaeon]